MSLFQRKDFIMHSGGKGYFKIECDDLTDEDIETIALIISKKYDFKQVRGVPTGGDRLMRALVKYRNPESNVLLLVDDVLTTGNSMIEKFHEIIRERYDFDYTQGVVVFARGECPAWIDPIFQMWEGK